jgi:Holliday junction resolvase RusA-like endonuclease
MMAKAAMGASRPLQTALEAFIYLTFPIPQSYSKKRSEACLAGLEKHLKRPDADNVAKAVIDGMSQIIFVNDSQIVSLHIHKAYGEIAKAEILVREA